VVYLGFLLSIYTDVNTQTTEGLLEFLAGNWIGPNMVSKILVVFHGFPDSTSNFWLYHMSGQLPLLRDPRDDITSRRN